MVLPFGNTLLLNAGLEFRKRKGEGKNTIGIYGKIASHELTFGGIVHLQNKEIGMLMILQDHALDLDIKRNIIGTVALYSLLTVVGKGHPRVLHFDTLIRCHKVKKGRFLVGGEEILVFVYGNSEGIVMVAHQVHQNNEVNKRLL